MNGRRLASCFLSLVLLMPSTARSSAAPVAPPEIQVVNPVGAFCEGFEETTPQQPFDGFSSQNCALVIQTPGPRGGLDSFLHTTDQAGGSFVIASGHFHGSYSALGTCAGLCYDLRLFNDGDANNHLLMTPWIIIRTSNGWFATFNAAPDQRISEDGGTNPGWH